MAAAVELAAALVACVEVVPCVAVTPEREATATVAPPTVVGEPLVQTVLVAEALFPPLPLAAQTL